jgi:zinc/manganese transport system substrate-binding protein
VASALPSRVILTYHRSWPYLANAFGLEIAGTVEPVPGIPPTARHLAEIVGVAKARHAQLLLQEPYFSNDAGRFLGREAGVALVVAAPSCDQPVAGSYLAHLQDILRLLSGAR